MFYDIGTIYISMFLLYIPRRINNYVDLKNCYIWILNIVIKYKI